MGIVYLAEHLHLHKAYAIKTIATELCTQWQINYFIKEARAAARINHPNVVTIHDAGEENGIHFIRMDYVDGKNLSELLHDRQGPLDWRDAIRLVRFAAKGLVAVQKEGIIHRDVKPSNIMLSRDQPPRVLLMDFGLAREESPADTSQPSSICGTPEYMSPEQWHNTKVDHRSDIYSLGVTLYTLLTGRPPFARDEVQEAIASKRPAPAIHQYNRRVPQVVVEAVNKAMSYNQQYRFTNAAAFAHELGTLLKNARDEVPLAWDTGTTSEFTDDTVPKLDLPQLELVELESKWDRWAKPARWAAAIAALAAVVGVLVWATGQRANPVRSHDGMVHIPAGVVHLGVDEDKVNRHFMKIPALKGSPELLKQNLNQARTDPPREAQLAEFWIDRYEVTNSQYAEFLKATSRSRPDHWSSSEPPPGKEDCPVENVRYEDANAYAAWASKQLPTEEQWLRAFRGDDDRLFPWGDDYDAKRSNVLDNKNLPIARSTPVTETPRDVSDLQVFNLVGNVSEWLRHEKDDSMYQARGANYREDGNLMGIATCAFKTNNRQLSLPGLGFRCVLEKQVAKE